MSDRVWLMGVACRTRLGVPASERRKPQKVFIDVGMQVDTSKAAAQDDFRLAVDYSAVEKSIRRLAESGERRLIETLAEQVAALVLLTQKAVRAVEVSVHKKPAVMPKTQEVVVRIRRRRG